MDVTRTQGTAYVAAGAATGAGLAALRHGSRPAAIALGVATGVAAGGVQAWTQGRSGSSELGWGAAMLGGTAAGALLLGGFGGQGVSPLKARGIGALIGGATGVFAPVFAGIALAQLQPAS